MIYDLIDFIKNEGDGEKLVLDNYKFKDGLYFVFQYDGNLKSFQVLNNKIVDSIDIEMERWLKRADYYSSIASTNKAFDAPNKKFHNCNYLSLMFKKLTLINDEFSYNINEKFYHSLDNFYKKMEQKLLSKEFNNFNETNKIMEVKIDEIAITKELFENCIQSIMDVCKEKNIKNDYYIKMFIFEEIEKYKIECKRYFASLIFNKNDYNYKIFDNIYGLSNNNMGTNDKKKFLVHQTTPFEVPFLITLDKAFKSKQLFEFLNFIDHEIERKSKDIIKKEIKNLSRGFIEIDSEYLKLEDNSTNKSKAFFINLDRRTRGTELEITDFEMLPHINSKLMKKFIFKNYLMLKNLEDTEINEKFELEQCIDENLFYYKLRQHYFYGAGDIKTLNSNLKKNILMYQSNFIGYFRKNDDEILEPIINKMSKSMVVNILINDDSKEGSFYYYKLGKALNMRFSLLKYFKIKEMCGLGERLKSLTEKLSKIVLLSESELENDDEYYFASGQLVRYYLDCSEAEKLNHSLLISFLNCKNDIKFKNEIMESL